MADPRPRLLPHLRRDPRRAQRRPAGAGAHRAGPHDAALPAGHERPGDHARHRVRDRARPRRAQHRRRGPPAVDRARPPGRGGRGTGADAVRGRARDVPELGVALGPRHRARHGPARARRDAGRAPARRGRDRGDRPGRPRHVPHRTRVAPPGGRDGVGVGAPAPVHAARGRRAAGPDRGGVAALVRPVPRPRAVGGRRRTQRAAAQAAAARPERVRRRGGDDVAAGEPPEGQARQELGLPLRLDPRRRLHAQGAVPVRDPRGDPGRDQLAAARHPPARAADAGLLHAARRAARSAGVPRGARLARDRAGRRRERGGGPAAAVGVRRRVRHGPALRRPRPRPRRRDRAAAGGDGGPGVRRVAAPRRRAVGAGAPGALHVVQAGLLAGAAVRVPPGADGPDPRRPRPVGGRGGADRAVGARALLVRAARRVRLVPGHGRARHLDPAARRQRFRRRPAHVVDDRRPARRARRRPAAVPLHGCGEGGGGVRRAVVLGGVGAARGGPHGRGAGADGRAGAAGQRRRACSPR